MISRSTFAAIRRDLALSTLLASGALAGTAAQAQSVPANALPVGGVVVSRPGLTGTVTVGGLSTPLVAGGTGVVVKDLNIGLEGQTTVINWTSYSIGTSNGVTYTAPAGATTPVTVLNRVSGALGVVAPSQIGGTLSAPGVNFWLINPAGILVGGNAAINTGSFYASTLDLCGTAACSSNADGTALDAFAAGGPVRLYQRSDFTAAPVDGFASGSIRTLASAGGAGVKTDTGPLVLVSSAIDTRGRLTSAGDVALIAASDMSFANPASPLSFTVAAGTAMNFVASGTSTVSGQHVTIAAVGRDSLSNALLNVAGTVTATSATVSDTGIVLLAATDATAATTDRAGVKLAATLSAAGSGVSIAGDTIAGNAADGGIVAGGNAALAAGRGNLSYGATIAAGGNVAIAAVQGTATLPGTVTAGLPTNSGAYTVDAQTGALGGTAASTQAASGLVRVTTTAGGITGGAGLVLRSNSGGVADAADARTLTLSATGGAVDFAAGSSLEGGTARQSLVRVGVTGASSLALGSIAARGLQGLTAPKLTTAGAIETRGAVTVDSTLDVQTTGGGITTDNTVTVGGTNQALTLTASGDILAKAALQSSGAATLNGAAVTVTSLTSTGSTAALIATGKASGATLRAQGGTASISAGSAEFDTIAGSTDATVDAGTIRVGSASASGGDVRLTATGNDLTDGTAALRLATATAGRNVTLQAAAGTVAATGDVIAGQTVDGGAYTVDGRAAALGATAASTQAASGLVRVTTTAGGISGGAGLVLRANSGGVADVGDARTLTLSAAGGNIDFAAGSSIEGGTARQSLVRAGVTGSSSLSLGTVAARGLQGLTAAKLATAGAIETRGAVTVDTTLDLQTTAGGITTDGLVTVGGLDQSLTLTASDVILAKAALQSSGAATLSGNAVTVTSLTSTGSTAAITATGKAAGTTLRAQGGTASIVAGSADFDTVSGATDATVDAGTIRVGGATGGAGDVRLTATAADLTDGTAALRVGGASAGRSVTLQAANGSASIGGTVTAANDLTASARAIDATGRTLTATHGALALIATAAADGASGVAVGTASAGTTVTLTAGTRGDVIAGAVTGGTDTAAALPGSVTLGADAGNVRVGNATSLTGDLRLTASRGQVTGLESVPGSPTGAVLSAAAVGRSVTVVAGTLAQVQSASAAQDLSIVAGSAANAIDGAVVAGAVDAGAGALTLSSYHGAGSGLAGVTLDAGTAGTTALVEASGRGDLAISTRLQSGRNAGAAIPGTATVRTAAGSIRAAQVESLTGDVAVTAVGGDVTGAPTLGGFGRIALDATAADRSVTVSAAAGTASLGIVGAGRDVTIDALAVDAAGRTATAGSGTLRIDARGGGVALGRGEAAGDVLLTAVAGALGAGDLVLGSARADRDVTLGAARDATVGGDVGAGGNYAVTAGGAISLAADGAATQTARGAVTLLATGDVTGGAGLTLRANDDGAGGEALSVRSTGGAVAFANGSALLGGTGDLTSDLRVQSVGLATFGTVKAGHDLLVDAGAIAAAGQSFTAGTGSVELDARGGNIALGSATAGGRVRLTAKAGGLGAGDLALGTASAGGDVLVDAAGDATVGGNVGAGGDYALTAGGAARLGLDASGTTQTARGAVTVLAGGDVSGGAGLTVRANDDTAGGEALSVQSTGGRITLAGDSRLIAGSGDAGSDLLVKALGEATLGAATAGRDLTIDARAVATAGQVATAEAGTLRVDARGGDVALGRAAAGVDALLTAVAGAAGAGDVALGGAGAGRDVTVGAGHDAAIRGDVAAGRSYSVTAADLVALGSDAPATQTARGVATIMAGGDIVGGAGLTLRANDDAAGAEALTLIAGGAARFADRSRLLAGAGDAGSDLLLQAAGPATFDTLTAGHDLTVTARSVAAAGHVVTAEAGTVRIAATGGDIAVGTARAGGGAGDVLLTARTGADGAGAIRLARASAGRNVTLDGSGDVTVVDNITAGGSYTVTASGAVFLGDDAGAETQAAGGAVQITAAGALRGGEGLRLSSASGTTSLRSTGGDVAFAASSSIQGGTPTGGRAVTVTADAGNVLLAGAITAGVPGTGTAAGYTVNAGGAVILGAEGAATLQHASGSATITAGGPITGLGDLRLASGSGAIGLHATTGAIAFSSASTIQGGLSGAARDVTIAADVGDVTLAGTVSAGNYVVQAGGAVTLGSTDRPVAQQAAGKVDILAGGAISGKGALTLASGGPVAIRSTKGAIAFAPDAGIRGGAGDVAVTADAGDVVMAGAVTAANYAIRAGGAVTLGTADAAITQQSAGRVDVLAGTGISGVGALTLASGGPVAIRSTGGPVAFAPTSSILGGTGDVAVAADAGSVALAGAVTAGNYAVTAGGVATLGTAGAAVVQQAGGAVTVEAGREIGGIGALTLSSGSGAISLHATRGAVALSSGSTIQSGMASAPRDLRVAADAGDVTLAGTVNAGNYAVQAGGAVTLGTTDAAILQRASGAIRIDAAGAIRGVGALTLASGSGGVALHSTGGPVSFSSRSTLQGGMSGSTGDVSVTADGAAIILAGAVTAADYAVRAGGGVTLGSEDGPIAQQASGGVTVEAKGAVEGAGALALSSGSGVIDIRSAGGAIAFASGSTLQGGAAGAGRDVRVTAEVGDVTLAGAVTAANYAVRAGGSIRLGAGDAAIAQRAAGSVSVAAAGAIDGLGALTLAAGSGPIALHAAGGAIRFSPVSALQGGANDVAIAADAGDVTLASAVTAGNYAVRAGGAVTLGSDGAAIVQQASGAASIEAKGAIGGVGALTLASGSGGIGIHATGGGITFASGAILRGGTATAARDVNVSADAGDVTIAGAVAAGTYAVRAGGAVALGSDGAPTVQQASGSVGVDARGAIAGLGGLQLASGSGPVSLHSTAGAIRFASASSIRGGSADAGRGVSVAADAGDVVLAGAVSAGAPGSAAAADYGVRAGGGVTLGSEGIGVIHQASGAVTVDAGGAIVGAGGLRLQSGSGPVAIHASNGAISFAAASAIQGGTAAAGSDVTVTADAGNVRLDGDLAAGTASGGAARKLTVTAVRGTIDLASSGTRAVIQQASGTIAIRAGGTITGGAGAAEDRGTAPLAAALRLQSGQGGVAVRADNGDVNFASTTTIQGGADAAGADVDVTALGAGGRASLGAVLAAGHTIAVHARDANLRAVAGRARSIDAGSGTVQLFNQASGTNDTRLGTAATDGGGFSLSQGELDRVRAATLLVGSGRDDTGFAAADRGAVQTIRAGDVRLSTDAGSTKAAFLASADSAAGPGSIVLDGVFTATGSPVNRTVQFGGGTETAATARAATIQLISTLARDSTTGQLDVGAGTLDLRAFRIVAGRASFDQAVLAAPDTVPANFIGNPNSLLYNAAATSPLDRYVPGGMPILLVNAGRMTVRFSDFALFQNTGLLGSTTGVQITGPLNAASPPLQFIAPGAQLTNGFALFGTVTQGDGGVPSPATALLGAAFIGVVDANGGNARVNGCLVGSSSGGCLATSLAPPTLNVFDVSRAQILSAGEELPVSYDPLVGTNDEVLFGDVAAGDTRFDAQPCPEGTVSPACREGTR